MGVVHDCIFSSNKGLFAFFATIALLSMSKSMLNDQAALAVRANWALFRLCIYRK